LSHLSEGSFETATAAGAKKRRAEKAFGVGVKVVAWGCKFSRPIPACQAE
jgi:hypothetical protein